jgi:geranylgeranyl diphosphate synthase, type II
MQSFFELTQQFDEYFSVSHFPKKPENLYQAAEYILQVGGKRVRPVSVLMGNELFDTISQDAWPVATAVELFHNFSLIHDDIMDNAPLRRGLPTTHEKYGNNTALLAGDVMFAQCYEYLNKVNDLHLHKILRLFTKTAKEVCEGQQMDMDFELRNDVTIAEYIKMIRLKTSVLLAASLQLGAIVGGASDGNQQHLYNFGINLGIAFQIQDDYLDAFGDPEKFGKQVGGDILANKKTFLYLHTLEVADNQQRTNFLNLVAGNTTNKVEAVVAIYKNCNVDAWANELKLQYYNAALAELEAIAVLNKRKLPLQQLAKFLLERES